MKGKFKPGLGMLNDQKGSTLSDQGEIKGKWKQYTENLYRRDKRMTHTSEQDPYEEQPVILESEVSYLESIGKK